ncbi:RNA polymerase sigma factor [Streptomyces longispororuber]|uniref:RNA polymerase sigma factor n=1 Tax=Streptomyces longispororuber TaxID=68230 RepID=UPI00210D4A01|nr:sigma-70 family RNA polymerase sigma factor [Streptomyces longispororuber]MCQ4205739.1 sigma-70 family RNA polymerase sigma factor [Streptomyces longispororuber]
MPEEAVSAANRAALESTFRDYRGEMIGRTRKLLAQWELAPTVDAEDVVHDAFVAALQAELRLNNPRAYLYTIIKNAVLEHARRHAMDRSSRALVDSSAASQAVLEDIAVQIANRSAVQQYLNDLPEQQRMAVMLTKGLGFSQSEAAGRMGKRPGTVATHVARASAFLKIHLAVTCAAFGALITLAAALGAGVVAHRLHPPAGAPHLPDPSSPRFWPELQILAVAIVVAAVIASLELGVAWLRRRERRRPRRARLRIHPRALLSEVGSLVMQWATTAFDTMDSRRAGPPVQGQTYWGK